LATTVKQRANVYVYAGWHTSAELQRRLMDDFIHGYVLCSKCKGPETLLVSSGTSKKTLVEMKCGACGALTPCPPGKLCNFVINSARESSTSASSKQPRRPAESHKIESDKTVEKAPQVKIRTQAPRARQKTTYAERWR